MRIVEADCRLMTLLGVFGLQFASRNNQTVRRLNRLGFASFGKVGKPVPEMRGTEDRIVARSEALVVQRYAVIESARVRDHRPWVTGCFQELADEFVLTDRVGTGRFDHAVQRFLQGNLRHGGGNIIRGDWLHHGCRNPNG